MTSPVRAAATAALRTLSSAPRPPVPPFTAASAKEKVRLAEDAWNSRDPHRVSLAYSVDTRWRNRSQYLNGREEVVDFLRGKWDAEDGYRLIKELFAFTDDRISVRFVYEWRDKHGQWFRACGNENWVFDGDGLMKERHASINDVPITEEQRLFRWPQGVRPEDHPGLSELGL